VLGDLKASPSTYFIQSPSIEFTPSQAEGLTVIYVEWRYVSPTRGLPFGSVGGNL